MSHGNHGKHGPLPHSTDWGSFLFPSQERRRRREMVRRPSMITCVGFSVFALGGFVAAAALGVETHQDVRPIVVLETSLGEIVLELRPDRAPKTVANFLGLVRAGFYDEMLFHRVVQGAVIQAGVLSMEGQVKGIEVETIENESRNRLTNRRGAVAMARNEDPQSATTEFFVNVRDNAELDYARTPRRRWGFAVFGRVIERMDVVDKIANIETKQLGPFPNFPSEPVAIYRAYVRE